MHAGWNALLKLRLDPLLSVALLSGCAGLVALPMLVAFGWPARAAWPWLAGSAFLHLAYYLCLTEAYRRADMSQVYPIARGGAPLLTAAASSLLAFEALRSAQVAGIIALGCGVAAMSVVGGRRGSGFDPVAVAFALLTALVICGYTLVDGIGARSAGDPHAYSAALFAINGLPILAVAWWRRGNAGMRLLGGFLPQGLAGGALSLGSYWIAIWAMTVAPIALVAALREASVLFAAVIAVAVLKEPLHWPRAAACAAILASLLLIRLG